MEALLRWTDSELGPVSPVEFIPIAEETDQIHRLGRWILQHACAQAQRWIEAGSPRQVSVNISPVQFSRATINDDILSAISAHGLPPGAIRIEVTEGALVNDLDAAVVQLRELRAAGVKVELDDFGTGYSSLAMLRKLPLDTIKIDKSLIDGIDEDPAAAILVHGIIDTVHALRLHVTAEGVERPGQLALLRRFGCDSAQGFLISRPQPADRLPGFRLNDAEEKSGKRVGVY